MIQGHDLFQELHPVSPGGTPSFGFGASQSAGGNAFGQPAAQGQAATTPAFGQQAASQPAPAFGTPNTGFGFGQSQPASSAAGGFNFGQPAAAPTPSTGFGFGQTQPAASASPILPTFGASTAQTTPGRPALPWLAASACNLQPYVTTLRVHCNMCRCRQSNPACLPARA